MCLLSNSISFPIVPDKRAKYKSKSLFNTVLDIVRCQECPEYVSSSVCAALYLMFPQSPAQPEDNYVTQGFQNLEFASEIIQLAIPHSKKPHNVWTIL